MRVKVSFSELRSFYSKGRTCQIVEIYPGKDVDTSTKQYDKNTPIKVRLIRRLPSGEIELLMLFNR